MPLGLQNPVIHIENVQFYKAGQSGLDGVHPVNLRGIFSGLGSYVRNCAIYVSYSRGIVLYGSSQLTISNNVIALVAGHGIFLEQGTETGNFITNNLVISNTATYAISLTDIEPAAFYITNPSNILQGNHAAGSDYYGFVIDPIQNSPVLCN
jgi:parallel beta-helix repeat protein